MYSHAVHRTVQLLWTEGMTYWDKAVRRVIQLTYFVSVLTTSPRREAFRRVKRGAHLLITDWSEIGQPGGVHVPPKRRSIIWGTLAMNSYTDSVVFATVCLHAVTGEPVNGFRWHLVTDSFTDIPEHVQTSTNPYIYEEPKINQQWLNSQEISSLEGTSSLRLPGSQHISS